VKYLYYDVSTGHRNVGKARANPLARFSAAERSGGQEEVVRLQLQPLLQLLFERPVPSLVDDSNVFNMPRVFVPKIVCFDDVLDIKLFSEELCPGTDAVL
jgi:hypothetical protein